MKAGKPTVHVSKQTGGGGKYQYTRLYCYIIFCDTLLILKLLRQFLINSLTEADSGLFGVISNPLPVNRCSDCIEKL